MMKVAKDAQTSHGKQSSLSKALNARLWEEATIVGDPRVTMAFTNRDGFQRIL